MLASTLAITTAAHAGLTLDEYEHLAKDGAGQMALDTWFDGYAAGIGYMYRGAVMRKSPTPWCVPDGFAYTAEQMRVIADRFIIDSKKARSELPPKTPMEAVMGTALVVYFDCRKSRM